MTRDHALIEELMAADALGGLDDDDRALLERERASHSDCSECREIEAGFAETAGRLAFTLTPEPVEGSMADRIIATTRATTTDPDPGPEPAPALAAPPGDLAEHRARRARPWRPLLAVAAVLAAAILAVATLRPSTTSVSRASTSQRIVAFSGQPEGSLAMAFTPGQPGAVLWGAGLPDPGADRVFEIWMIEGGSAVSGGCVTPVDGVVALSVDADIGTAETMAVTEESSDCPSAPTSDPFMAADLTTI
jgi:hypothetical protein